MLFYVSTLIYLTVFPHGDAVDEVDDTGKASFTL